MGLLASKVYNPASVSISVTITSGLNTVTSAGLFTAAMDGRLISGASAGIPGNTRFTYVDASNGTLSANATASNTSSRTIGARFYSLPNSGQNGWQDAGSPGTHFRLDTTNLVLPTFVAPASGIVQVIATCNILGYPATNADSYLEWSIMDGSDAVVWPIMPTTATYTLGAKGRRVNLHQANSHRAKLEMRVSGLTPGATIGPWYWGVHSGNQVNIAPPASDGFAMRMGGAQGPGSMEVWAL